MLIATDLRCEGRTCWGAEPHPVTDEEHPELKWICTLVQENKERSNRNKWQQAYRVQVSQSLAFDDLCWDSGKVMGDGV